MTLMTIVVTGGSGLIGTALTKALLSKGYTVIVVDVKGPRLTHQNLFFIPCNLGETTLPFNVLERTDAVIHLAGASIREKWTPLSADRAKERMVRTTEHLMESLRQTTNKPPLVVTASTTAYYGDGFERDLDERSARGDDEFTTTIEAREKTALEAEAFGCRVVIVRTAPVIARGGFLAPVVKLAKFHLVAPLKSDTDDWMPWIHINDLVRIYLFALETSTLQGVVNAASPMPISHETFTKAVAVETKSINLKGFLGRMVRKTPRIELLLNQRVLPQRLIDKGFAFAYTNIREAIADILHEKN